MHVYLLPYILQALKINVDMLKLIQLGLTFTDAEGNLPICNGEHTVWQFNFRGFRLSEDVYAQDSIELLKQSGIDFAQNEVSKQQTDGASVGGAAGALKF